MAEIVTWVTETTTISTGARSGDTVTTGKTTVTRVTSFRANHPDVSVLRDMVRALDIAGAPGRALLRITSTDISAEWTQEPTPAEVPEDSASPEGGADRG